MPFSCKGLLPEFSDDGRHSWASAAATVSKSSSTHTHTHTHMHTRTHKQAGCSAPLVKPLPLVSCMQLAAAASSGVLDEGSAPAAPAPGTLGPQMASHSQGSPVQEAALDSPSPPAHLLGTQRIHQRLGRAGAADAADATAAPSFPAFLPQPPSNPLAGEGQRPLQPPSLAPQAAEWLEDFGSAASDEELLAEAAAPTAAAQPAAEEHFEAGKGWLQAADAAVVRSSAAPLWPHLRSATASALCPPDTAGLEWPHADVPAFQGGPPGCDWLQGDTSTSIAAADSTESSPEWDMAAVTMAAPLASSWQHDPSGFECPAEHILGLQGGEEHAHGLPGWARARGGRSISTGCRRRRASLTSQGRAPSRRRATAAPVAASPVHYQPDDLPSFDL